MYTCIYKLPIKIILSLTMCLSFLCDVHNYTVNMRFTGESPDKALNYDCGNGRKDFVKDHKEFRSSVASFKEINLYSSDS